MPVTVPCGQCSGCRLERSRQWAIRCFHEASLYNANSFVTLTYSDTFLPEDRSVSVREMQLFMKRLRKRFGPRIRFFACGEYGELLGRPHYHVCLFNHDFEDRVYLKDNESGDALYTSESLLKIWSDPVSGYPLGHCLIGDVTFQSAAYVARYIMKKITGEAADNHYVYVDPLSGDRRILAPEFVTMSRRPGIGKLFLDKYKDDIYPGDFVVVNGKKVKVPRYYDQQYEIAYPDEYAKLKRARKAAVEKHKWNNTDRRLRVREKVHAARMGMLPRSYEGQ